jgi:hypothetical protein
LKHAIGAGLTAAAWRMILPIIFALEEHSALSAVHRWTLSDPMRIVETVSVLLNAVMPMNGLYWHENNKK